MLIESYIDVVARLENDASIKGYLEFIEDEDFLLDDFEIYGEGDFFQLTVTILNEEAEFVVNNAEEENNARRTADNETASEKNKNAERVAAV